MNLLQIELYKKDISKNASRKLDWQKLKDKSIILSGATGLIGSYLIDLLMYKNIHSKLNCKIYAICRNEQKAKKQFSDYDKNTFFNIVQHDINFPMNFSYAKINYALHLASNTHPVLYAKEPVSTIMTNIIGTKNFLDFAVSNNVERFAFASSNEIYGENKGDVEFFTEDYCGYINSNTLRAGYNESKRCGEALCQAYINEKKLDVVIPRLTRTFGPTMKIEDSKASSQFIKNAVENKDVELKSEGEQFYSYTYVADAVFGLLYVLLEGKTGEAYNISDASCDIKLKDFALLAAKLSGGEVKFTLPTKTESTGFSKATKARLDGTKLHNLGWNSEYNIEEGLKITVEVLRELYTKGEKS